MKAGEPPDDVLQAEGTARARAQKRNHLASLRKRNRRERWWSVVENRCGHNVVSRRGSGNRVMQGKLAVRRGT